MILKLRRLKEPFKHKLSFNEWIAKINEETIKSKY